MHLSKGCPFYLVTNNVPVYRSCLVRISWGMRPHFWMMDEKYAACSPLSPSSMEEKSWTSTLSCVVRSFWSGSG